MSSTMRKVCHIHIPLLLCSLVFMSTRICASVVEQPRGYMLSRRYAPVDYGSGLQNWWAVEDDRGVMYFANLNGVLEFDGEQWRSYRVGRNAAVRCLARDAHGRIYVGAYAELGYMALSERGEMRYQSLEHLLDARHARFRDVWCAHTFGDTVLFLSDASIMRYAHGQFTYFDSPESAFYLAFEMNGRYYVQERGRGLLRLHGDSLVLVSDVPLFKKAQLHGLFPRADGTVLVATRHLGLHVFNPTTGKTEPIDAISPQAQRINGYFKKHSYYYGIALPNGNLVMGSLMGDVLVVDERWNIVDVIDRTVRQSDSEVLFLYFSRSNLLWLGLGDGLCQVEVYSDLRYWNRALGIYGQISDVAYHADHLYISTKQGIFCARSTPETFGYTHFDRIDANIEATHSFLRFAPGAEQKPMLLAGSGTGVYHIDHLTAHRISAQPGVHNLYQSVADPTAVFTASAYGLGLLRYGRGRWVDCGMQFGIADAVRGISHDTLGNIWVATEGDGVYRIANFNPDSPEQAQIQRFDTAAGYPQFDRVYLGNTPTGLRFMVNRSEYYTFNATTQRFDYHSEAVPPQTASNAMYSSRAFARFRLGTRSFMFYPNGHLEMGRWYNSDDGMVRFIARPESSTDTVSVAPVIGYVHTSDSVFYCGHNFVRLPDGTIAPSANPHVKMEVELAPQYGTLCIHYACPCFSREHHVEYSTRLLGYTQSWSEWSIEHKKDYTDLPAGTYTFEVRARELGQFISPTASFTFTVRRSLWSHPLFWGTILGLILIAMLLALWRSYTRNMNLEHTLEQQKDIIADYDEEIETRLKEEKMQLEVISERDTQLKHASNIVKMQRKYLLNIKKELEQSNKDKIDMIRTLAHDLRGAVGAWVMISDQLQLEVDNLSRDELNAYLEDISRHAHNTHDLLEQQLDWTALQSHDIRYSPSMLSLVEVANSVAHVLRFRLNDKRISLNIDIAPDINVWADEYMLSAVLRNLLTNAVKFSHPESQVSLSAHVVGYYCRVLVADKGVGIAPAVLPTLFDVRQSTRGTSNERGLGVGLGVCRELVERNGGRIYVCSEQGVGSTFAFTLPLTQPAVSEADAYRSYIV